jgi:hypothetical protein
MGTAAETRKGPRVYQTVSRLHQTPGPDGDTLDLNTYAIKTDGKKRHLKVGNSGRLGPASVSDGRE